jgi:hypothetical protein
VRSVELLNCFIALELFLGRFDGEEAEKQRAQVKEGIIALVIKIDDSCEFSFVQAPDCFINFHSRHAHDSTSNSIAHSTTSEYKS